MNKQDKIKRILADLKGEKEEKITIAIIDRTCEPAMYYDNIGMDNGIPLTKDELDAYDNGRIIIEIINDRSQIRK
ncbi:MAG: hypothetical protein KH100_05130 [Dysgonomonas mossii]|uniref:hypothetical protein n=1 Tax=Dysgonomonas mossii TaxID=163665 RepID=UPI001DE8F445|nr:hypothetical protein [Dysgonomonas mossii]MBS5797871.1 hypothetical protein [Dysgonomonas mossii]MBS7110568.1 hypothetical protein [Dysgonomonas mossii]